MSSTYYTSFSGMMAASYGLQNTSNNIANMQSPGFKRSDVFYSSLGDGAGQGSLGSGVTIGGQSTNFSPGSYLSTDNPTDLAIVGNGFFIVKLPNGELVYTRDGEFEFNKDGMLIDKHSGGLVQGYDQHGGLVPIQRFGPRTSPGKATHSVNLKGEFVLIEKDPANQSTGKYEHVKFDVPNIYDDKGKPHKVTLEFEATSDNLNWKLVSATCDGQDIIYNPDSSIQFNMDSNGSAKDEFSTIKLTLFGTQSVSLNFGEYMNDNNSSVRLYNKKMAPEHFNSSVTVNKQDGYGVGKQIGFSFDDNGQISYNYDNGQSQKGVNVALATFDDLEHTLVQANDNLFRAKSTDGRKMGSANKHGFGTIQPKKIENSNVNSTMEFSNIVVLQRMFQACSQIMDIDKQLLEELNGK